MRNRTPWTRLDVVTALATGTGVTVLVGLLAALSGTWHY